LIRYPIERGAIGHALAQDLGSAFQGFDRVKRLRKKMDTSTRNSTPGTTARFRDSLNGLSFAEQHAIGMSIVKQALERKLK
jgi:hypothetical protein